MSEILVERLKRLSAAATPERWAWDGKYTITSRAGMLADDERDVCMDTTWLSDEDWNLIIGVRNALPLLLDVAEAVGRHIEAKRKSQTLAEMVAMAEDGRTADWSIALTYEAMEAAWEELQEVGDEAD